MNTASPGWPPSSQCGFRPEPTLLKGAPVIPAQAGIHHPSVPGGLWPEPTLPKGAPVIARAGGNPASIRSGAQRWNSI